MAGSIGSFVGLVLGAALVGALFAWVLRRIVTMPVARSQAVGVSIATLLYLLFSDGLIEMSDSVPVGLLIGVLGGLLAFGILRLTARGKG